MRMVRALVVVLALSLGLVSAPAGAQGQVSLVPIPEGLLADLDAEGSALVTVSFDSLDPLTTPLGGLSAHSLQTRSDFVQRLSFDPQVVTEFETLAALQMRVTSAEQLDEIAALPFVRAVSVSRILLPTGAAGAQINSTPNATATGTAQMHMLGIKGQTVRVAVFDSGWDSDHPDLAGAVVHERCFLQFVGTCPNGTGRQGGPGSAEDNDGHGTAVTGIITGAGISGALGIAPATKIESYKVLGAQGATAAEITAALDYILANRPAVKIINMSLGGGAFTSASECNNDYPPFVDAVIALRSRGTIVIASTGNQGNTAAESFPGCVPSVVSVAATANSTQQVASFSNRASFTDVAAPGVGLLTSDLGGGSTLFGGTSASAPVVSACAALMVQDGFDTYAELRARIVDSSKSMTGSANYGVPWLTCAPACDGFVPTVNMGLGETATGLRDIIIGTNEPETIRGFGGNDVICGHDGIDVIEGGLGNDVIFGGGGSDRIYGQGGSDEIWAGSGADRVWGGTGSDDLFGMGGQDRMWGEGGNDLLQGNHQSDDLYGGNGNDTIRGAGGKDELWGDDGDDVLAGGDNSDELRGGTGFDTGDGQKGSDTCISIEVKTSC